MLVCVFVNGFWLGEIVLWFYFISVCHQLSTGIVGLLLVDTKTCPLIGCYQSSFCCIDVKFLLQWPWSNWSESWSMIWNAVAVIGMKLKIISTLEMDTRRMTYLFFSLWSYIEYFFVFSSQDFTCNLYNATELNLLDSLLQDDHSSKSQVSLLYQNEDLSLWVKSARESRIILTKPKSKVNVLVDITQKHIFFRLCYWTLYIQIF